MKRIVITGASGFIGKHLSRYLKSKNYEVVSLSRSHSETTWNLEKLDGWERELKSADVIINLAGENVGKKRWSSKRKNELINSRLSGIDSLLSGLASTKQCPSLFIQISGVGYYGNRSDEILTEESTKGVGFMADLSENIEKRIFEVESCIKRKVSLRFGIVLGLDGGALPKLLLPFKLFFGGPFGKGNHYVSWIHIEDVCRMIEFLIENNHISGVINGVSPGPLKNKALSKIIGRVLRRPAFMPAPSFLLKLFLGRMGSELLLYSQRVKPEKLEKEGFVFKYADFGDALSSLIKGK